MNGDATRVQVGRRAVELSNLDKVLYPGEGLIKAEVIAYYTTVSAAFLRHSRGRPLSLVRFPDGIDGEAFFQKNVPGWAPAWVRARALSEGGSRQVVLTETAVLVWLANSAALEIHTTTTREPDLDRPDHLAFDLDPPEELPFAATRALARALCGHLEALGYVPFVKTSGRKGLHVVVPVRPEWDVETCFEAAKDAAASFVRGRDDATTHLSKQKRRGRTLVDVLRNARGQTMVAPYSLRGVPGAPVSTPVTWEELDEIDDPSVFTIDRVMERLAATGDAWEALHEHATGLHTQDAAPRPSPALAEYARRRDFHRTREPAPGARGGEGRAFVIHRHHASRLHYDLRLEQGGVLRSWAVPKGLPPRPGVKRLAVATEDHPVDYLDFEGDIPRDQYGGGRMWIFARGRYEVEKQSARSLLFSLSSDQVQGRYQIYRTGEEEWLLERLDEPEPDWLRTDVDPMAPTRSDYVPEGEAYVHEMKWDGIRAVVAVDEGDIRITTRNGLDVTAHFPELRDAAAFRAASALFDGEIVCLGPEGRPDFEAVIGRLHGRAPRTAPAYCMLFDCLYLDGRPVMAEPLWRRREWLEDVLRGDAAFRASELYRDGFALFDAAGELSLEGIVSKRLDARYVQGRSTAWLKVKLERTDEFLIVGYRPAKGTSGAVGALHLAEYDDGALVYRGKVGTGFTDRVRRDLYRLLASRPVLDRSVRGRPRDDGSTWIRPDVVCEVAYAERTAKGRLRAPSFRRLRSDKTPAEISTRQRSKP